MTAVAPRHHATGKPENIRTNKVPNIRRVIISMLTAAPFHMTLYDHDKNSQFPEVVAIILPKPRIFLSAREDRTREVALFPVSLLKITFLHN
jgi:hypothetical protein